MWEGALKLAPRRGCSFVMSARVSFVSAGPGAVDAAPRPLLAMLTRGGAVELPDRRRRDSESTRRHRRCKGSTLSGSLQAGHAPLDDNAQQARCDEGAQRPPSRSRFGERAERVTLRSGLGVEAKPERTPGRRLRVGPSVPALAVSKPTSHEPKEDPVQREVPGPGDGARGAGPGRQRLPLRADHLDPPAGLAEGALDEVESRMRAWRPVGLAKSTIREPAQ